MIDANVLLRPDGPTARTDALMNRFPRFKSSNAITNVLLTFRSEEQGWGVPVGAPASAPAARDNFAGNGALSAAPNAAGVMETNKGGKENENPKLQGRKSPLAAVIAAATAGDPT